MDGFLTCCASFPRLSLKIIIIVCRRKWGRGGGGGRSVVLLDSLALARWIKMDKSRRIFCHALTDRQAGWLAAACTGKCRELWEISPFKIAWREAEQSFQWPLCGDSWRNHMLYIFWSKLKIHSDENDVFWCFCMCLEHFPDDGRHILWQLSSKLHFWVFLY